MMNNFTCHSDGNPCRCTNGEYMCGIGLGTRQAEAGEIFPYPVKSTNPKKTLGMKKPPMHLVPAAGNIHEAMAFKDGAEKYGPYNWREDPVDVSTYVAAIQRHLDLYRNGQDYTSDTDVHNLGAIRACCNILLDAELHGSLIDDRHKQPNLEDLVDRYTVGKGLPA